MSEFGYATGDITDDMLRETAVNVGKYWTDKIEKDLLEKLTKIPSGHQLYLVAVPPAYDAGRMHIEFLEEGPDKPYRFMHSFDYAPMYRRSSPMLWGVDWGGPSPKVEPVVWKEEPVVEVVPVWQYWVAAAAFAIILCLAGGVV